MRVSSLPMPYLPPLSSATKPSPRMEMEILDTKDGCFLVGDELLDFNLGGGGDSAVSSPSLEYSNPTMAALAGENLAGPFPGYAEEELEWLSNKEAFPGVETCFGILSDNPELIKKHRSSPISVLENSTSTSNTNGNTNSSTIASCCDSFKVPTNHPVRARTKRTRQRRVVFGNLSSQHLWLSNQLNLKSKQESSSLSPSLPLQTITNSRGATMGRRCLHCQADKTPQWRAGPMGPKTLCNACGVRYKSGRLLPEYRPASSPTFSSELHSNSHRKVVEMRRQKQVETGRDGVWIQQSGMNG